jgi:hypothetical protein
MDQKRGLIHLKISILIFFPKGLKCQFSALALANRQGLPKLGGTKLGGTKLGEPKLGVDQNLRYKLIWPKKTGFKYRSVYGISTMFDKVVTLPATVLMVISFVLIGFFGIAKVGIILIPILSVS